MARHWAPRADWDAKERRLLRHSGACPKPLLMLLPLTCRLFMAQCLGWLNMPFLVAPQLATKACQESCLAWGRPKPYPLRETCSHAACSQAERLPRGWEVVGHLHTASPHRYFALNCVTYMVMFFLPTQLTQIFPDFAAWQVGLRNAVPTAFKP